MIKYSARFEMEQQHLPHWSHKYMSLNTVSATDGDTEK